MQTMRDPSFWWRPVGLAAALLSPLAAVYGAVAAWRLARPGQVSPRPVLCIGNLTLGGAGKTPTAIAVAEILRAAGREPYVLSRGYGGTIAAPERVDAAAHRAVDVGDEPLLLARLVPTMVARDRVLGANSAAAMGANSIVMDDGFQNPSLRKDLSMLVVDGRRGIGNGKVFPAGPLRAPLENQLGRAQAMLVMGPGPAGEALAAVAQAHGLQVFHGQLEPDAKAVEALKGHPVLAFAGIGDPEKFFATLRGAGIDVREEVAFPDHHHYRRIEARNLIERAERERLILVTTEKDLARLAGQDDLAALATVARALPVALKVAEDAAFREWVLTLPVADANGA